MEMVSNSYPGNFDFTSGMQDFSRIFIILQGFVSWICQYFISLFVVTGVMHDSDDAYSIPSTWSCNWLDQFLNW